MTKIYSLLFLCFIFFNCSSDNIENSEDVTTKKSETLPNSIVGKWKLVEIEINGSPSLATDCQQNTNIEYTDSNKLISCLSADIDGRCVSLEKTTLNYSIEGNRITLTNNQGSVIRTQTYLFENEMLSVETQSFSTFLTSIYIKTN